MKTRKLKDIDVSEVGMGCMAFSHGYGQIPTEEYGIEAIRNAYDHGCTFFDTAEVYSPNLAGIGHNELIVGKALKDVREHVVIATKLMLHGVGSGNVYKTIRKHLEGSMERLQTDHIDLYYLHRMSGRQQTREEYFADMERTPANLFAGVLFVRMYSWE